MGRVSLEEAYPGICFRPRTRNWWARLTRVPPECVHLEVEQGWIATLVPDTLFLRGKAAPQRRPQRPEVSLCRVCCLAFLRQELVAFPGRVVAFEPDAERFSQYFFVEGRDFAAAGVEGPVAEALRQRLAGLGGTCQECSKRARWLWFSRQQVRSLDEFARIAQEPGQRLCAAHGAAALCRGLEAIAEANVFYLNVPYGEAGAYLWI